MVDSVEILIRAATDGAGLAWVSEDYVAPQLASGKLLRVLEDWCQPFPGFFLYYASRRQQPVALAALINTLRF
jgi:DNA-binding transcriptional LysR family regulator